MRAQDQLEGGAVEGAHSMLDDVEVAGLLTEVRVYLRAPFTQLEESVLASAREDRRVGRALPIPRRKTDPDKANEQTGSTCLVKRSPGVLHDPARSRLLPIRTLAIRSVCMDQIVFHVQYQINTIAHDRTPSRLDSRIRPLCMRGGRPTQQDTATHKTRNSENHLACFQIGALCRAQPQEFAEYVGLVLAERGCQPADADVVSFGKSHGCADRKTPRNIGGAYLGRRTACAQVRIARNVLHAPGDMGTHACALQSFSRGLGIARGKPLHEQRIEL